MRLSCACCAQSSFFAAPADAGGQGVRRPPSAGPVDAELTGDVVAANRILAKAGVLDGYGHVSLRHPAKPDHFLLSRSLAPALVTRADLMEFGPDSEGVAGESRNPYLERYIHGEIYRARPDVMCVVHSHSPSVIPFGVSKTPMRAMFHMSGYIAAGAPVFDIREKFGETDMLISNCAQGAALAETLADKHVALMRGHGCVTVGTTIAEAVYRAMYLEENAKLQREAMSLDGPPTYLSVEEGRRANETVMKTIARPWELWKAGVEVA